MTRRKGQSGQSKARTKSRAPSFRRSPRRSTEGPHVAPHARLPIPGESAESHTVQIEKPVYGGSFLARVDGKALFVPLVLPGEQARLRVVEEKRNYASAEAEEIAQPAPQRIAPNCPHFGACGGCQYQHAGYPAQLLFKQAILRETLERAGIHSPDETEVLAAQPWEYRNRIRLAFDPTGKPGYRGRRSHSVIPIAQCPIAAPTLVQTALAAAESFARIAPRDRPVELSLFCDAAEAAVLASVFTARLPSAAMRNCIDAILGEIPALAGVELAQLQREGQARSIIRWGEESLHYRVAEFDYRVDQGAFFQVNRWLVDSLARRVAAGHHGQLAWDLFAGVGLFARLLTSGFDHVVAVESAPAATDALQANLAGASATAVKATALDFLRRRNRRSEPPDLIVVDPPRTGLGAETAALIAQAGAPHLTYVSCDPATLARDLRVLINSCYAIERLTLADLFPQTFHLETIVDLRQSAARPA